MSRRAPGRGRDRGDEGAASPLVLGLAVALVLLSLVLVVAGHMVVERRRAAAGADLAALAGAVELQHGREACPAAHESADRNGVELTSCRVEGDRVRVSTANTVRLLGRDLRVRAHAHAGPVGDGG
jgi:secretion/DNA translocation related TadE-like protein